MVTRLASDRANERQPTVLRAAPVAREARELRVPRVGETVLRSPRGRLSDDRARDVRRGARHHGCRDERRDRGQGPTDGAPRHCTGHRCQPGPMGYLGKEFSIDIVPEGVGGVTRTER